jgi:hypothetical protein
MTDYQWKPIETAPYGVTILVRNGLMTDPVRATRGYVHNGAVHADQRFFTSVYTPNFEGMPFPAGKLVCPTEWTEFDD